MRRACRPRTRHARRNRRCCRFLVRSRSCCPRLSAHFFCRRRLVRSLLRPAMCWRGPLGWLRLARPTARRACRPTSPTPRLAPDSWTSRPSAPTHPVAPPHIRRVRGAPLRYAHVWTDWTLLDVESLTTLYRTGRRQPPRGVSRDVASRVWASRDGNPSDGNPRARSPCKVTEGAQARTLSKAGTGKGHVWGRIVRG